VQAVRLRTVGQVEIEDVPEPVAGPGEALVQVQAVGVCGSDIPRAFVKGAHVMPITLGHEFSGTVVAVGPGAAGWQPGDRVVVTPMIPCGQCEWCREGHYSVCDRYDYFGSRRDGAMAQYVNAPVHTLLRIPDNVSYAAAALTDPAAIATWALFKAGTPPIGPGMVYGAGAIGLLAVQIMRLLGLDEVFVVDVDDAKLELAHSLGATHGINARREDPVAAVREATGGRMAGTVLETAGLPETQHQAVLSTGKRGTCVWIGISHRDLSLSPAAVDAVLRREIRIVGSWNSFSAPFPGPQWRQVLAWLSSGELQAEPIISHRFPLLEAPGVLTAMARREFVYNKVLFIPPGSEVTV